jgi:hypothetical protein
MASFTGSQCARPILAAFALCALSAALPLPAAAQEIAPSAQRQMSALLAEKASRSPAQAKIDSHLLHAAMAVSGQQLDPELPPLAGEVKAVRADAGNMVEVEVRAAVTDALLTAIRAAGGSVISSFPEYESVRARMPLARLESIATRPEVRQIRAAEAWQINGALGLSKGKGMAARGQVMRERLAAYLQVPRMSFAGLLPALNTTLFAGQTSVFQGVDVRGDTAMAANTVRSNFGFDGTGIRIGVLSDGVDSLAAAKTAGTLPAVNVIAVNGALQNGSGDEGTAMLEIVYSLAPGATLYFATATSGSAQMAANIQALAGAPYNCQVIVDDVNYFNEGVFQDGVIAHAVNQVAASGVLYFSSAGNSGNALNGTSGTWQGDFNDSGTSITAVSAKESQLPVSKAVSIHTFDGVTNFDTLTTLSQSSWSDGHGDHTGHYELKWSDPLGRSNNDYDLFILNKDMTQVLASSTNVQNGNQDPEESINDNYNLYDAQTNPNGPCAPSKPTAPCRVVIAKESTAAVRTLYLDTERGVLAQATHGATYGHNSTSGALTVAATDARAACYNQSGWNHCDPFTTQNISQWAAAYDPSPQGGVERFSSDGPRLMYYDSSGSPYTPNNFVMATGGGITLNKPDLTAADCVPTGVLGFSTFCGTSAAAPHAAAVAALMLQAKPGTTAADVTAAGNMLVVSGSPGWNETSGMGVLMADKSIDTLCAYSATAPAVAPAGGSYSLSISANPGCQWTVSASGWPSWMTMTSSPSGTGNGSISFTVADNAGMPRSATVTIFGQSVNIAQASSVATARAGTIAHIATGGAQWDSEIWVVNNSATPAIVHIDFYADNGSAGLRDANSNPVNIPYTATVSGSPSSGAALPNSMDFSLNPYGTLVLVTNGASNPTEAHGWADVLSSSASLTGFCIFRSPVYGAGIAPLQTLMGAKTLTMPFDNTNAIPMGVALDNIGSAAADVTATAWDLNGTPIVTSAMVQSSFAVGAHAAFLLNTVAAGAMSGKQGLIQFQIGGSGALSGIGLRFGSVGALSAFTSVPVTLQ